jgi:hypothetical protein
MIKRFCSILVCLALGTALQSGAMAQGVSTQAQQQGDCNESCVKITTPDHEGWGCVAGEYFTGKNLCEASQIRCGTTKCGPVALLGRDGTFLATVKSCDGTVDSAPKIASKAVTFST